MSPIIRVEWSFVVSGIRNVCSASTTSIIDIAIAVNAARRSKINVRVYLMIKYGAKREM